MTATNSSHKIRTTLQHDFYRESGRWLTHWQMLKKCINPNLHFIYWFRNAQKHPRNTLMGKLLRLILRRYQIRYGFQIYPETQIGDGLYLGHWGTVVVNPDAKIGRNCNLAQGVTIAQANRGKMAGAPSIGNEVWIGPNAVVVGNISIGDNVLIAPNAYVNADVPSNSVVVGNPAVATFRENATEGYINYRI